MFAEPWLEPGLVRAVPPERRQVLEFPEETHVQPVVPEPGQPVAVQQHGERRKRRRRVVSERFGRRDLADIGRRRRLHDRRRGHRRPEAAAADPAADDQFRLAAGVHDGAGRGHHAGIRRPQDAPATRAHPDHADRRDPRQKQEQILSDPVINGAFSVIANRNNILFANTEVESTGETSQNRSVGSVL